MKMDNYWTSNSAVSSDWKKVPQVVCKKMEHVIVSYLRKIRDIKEWSFEVKHEFRLEYS
jgi:hypothetical protein